MPASPDITFQSVNAIRRPEINGTAVNARKPIRFGRMKNQPATREPPPADHPLMRLLRLPNFILTPHTAWASEEAIQSLADQLIDNIEAFWAGAPRNVVTA